jgi:uncharacterized membrane protein
MDVLPRVINALTTLHPPHSLTVHFPIAFSALGVLLLAVAWWRREECLERAAFIVMGLTVLASVVAGAVGIFDNLTRYGGEAPFASTKIVLAVALLVLSLGLVLARRRQASVSWSANPMLIYLVAFAICFGMAGVLGFLGGAIVWGF